MQFDVSKHPAYPESRFKRDQKARCEESLCSGDAHPFGKKLPCVLLIIVLELSNCWVEGMSLDEIVFKQKTVIVA